MHVPLFKKSWSCCLSALLLLAACSAPPPPPPPLRIRWAHDPESADPLQLPGPEAVELFNLLHCGLLQLNYQSRQFEPALAEALPEAVRVGDSLTRLIYQVRPQATWDDGRPVLAGDVAFTLKLLFCPGLPNEAAQGQYSFLREVQLDPANPRRLTLLCQGQAADLPQATGGFAVLSEATLDPGRQLRRFSLAALRAQSQAGGAPDTGLLALSRRYRAADVGHHPERLPGCGAYRLAAWVRDRYVLVKRKPDWWADGLPKPVPAVLLARPGALRYDIIPDEVTAALALQRGDIDLYPQIPAPAFARLRQSEAARRELQFHTASSHEVVTAGFNTRHPALADPLTRQALSRLFDAEGLRRATQLGGGERTASIIPPTDRTHYNDSLPLIPFDVAKAETMLRRAGWQRTARDWERGKGPDRQRLRLVVRYRPDVAFYETIALQFREAAGRAGIPVELRPTEASALNGVLQAGDFDVYLRSLKGNPFVFNFAPVLHSASVGEGNLTGFSNPAADRLIEAIPVANTPQQQVRLVRRFQALLHAQVPLVPLFFLPVRLAASRRVQGLRAFAFKPGYVPTNLDVAPAAPLKTTR